MRTRKTRTIRRVKKIKQIGGTCKEKYERQCNSSCKKICHYVEGLPKGDFRGEMRYKISALQQNVDALKIEHRRLADLARARYELTKPPIYAPVTGGSYWFGFDVPENKKCIEECEKICVKSEKATCDKVAEIVHPLEDNYIYKFLLEQETRLKSEIVSMKYNQGIRV